MLTEKILPLSSNSIIMEKADEIKKLVFSYMDNLTTKKYSDLKEIYTKLIDLSNTANYTDIVRNSVFEYEDTHLEKSIVWRGAYILMSPSMSQLDEFLTSPIVTKKKKS